MERLNPPPAPEGRGYGVSDHRGAVAEVAKGAQILAIIFCILLQIFSGGVLYPPYNPPRRPAHSAGRLQKAPGGRLEIDQNFDHFLDSIFGRFGVVLGRHLGVIFGTFGGQDGLPSAILYQTLIFEKTSAVWATARFGRSEPSKIDPGRLQEALEE